MLIKLARHGDPRPRLGTLLGQAFTAYTTLLGKSFDAKLTETLRSLRPDWFGLPARVRPERVGIDEAKAAVSLPSPSRSAYAIHQMHDLLEIARRGEDRPSFVSPEGQALASFVSPSASRYDETFSTVIRQICPEWFRTGQETARTDPAGIKQRLLAEAIAGHRLGDDADRAALRAYTTLRQGTFDPEFTKLVALVAPDWLPNPRYFASDRETNKDALFRVAAAGRVKPSRKTKLGQVLSTYVSERHRSHDREFTRRLRDLRPDWFEVTPVSIKAA
jgi:hypothetical protein